MDVLKKFRREEREEISTEANLSIKQRLAVLGLVVFSVAVVFVSLAETRSSIYKHFKTDNDSKVLALCPDGQCYVSEEHRLRSVDTDGDGLSDWDELYVYSTSPYLEDSDGDGISDFDEIMRGTDPNCPEGKDCSADLLSISPPAGDLGDLFLSEDQVKGKEGDLMEMLQGGASADILRKVLIESGMDKDLLDKMSDEDLVSAYFTTMEMVSASESLIQ